MEEREQSEVESQTHQQTGKLKATTWLQENGPTICLSIAFLSMAAMGLVLYYYAWIEGFLD